MRKMYLQPTLKVQAWLVLRLDKQCFLRFFSETYSIHPSFTFSLNKCISNTEEMSLVSHRGEKVLETAQEMRNGKVYKQRWGDVGILEQQWLGKRTRNTTWIDVNIPRGNTPYLAASKSGETISVVGKIVLHGEKMFVNICQWYL